MNPRRNTNRYVNVQGNVTANVNKKGNKQIVQEEHLEKDLRSGTLLYFAWNKKHHHKQGHNKDISKTKYWSERCILTNQPTSTIFWQHNLFLHDAWCKKKEHKTDKQNEIIRQMSMRHLQPAVIRQHSNQFLHDKKRRHKIA